MGIKKDLNALLFWRYLLKLSLGTLLCTLLAVLAKVETQFLNGGVSKWPSTTVLRQGQHEKR